MTDILKRLDKITTIDDLSETPCDPKSVKIELTSRCNFNCTYCARRTSKRAHGDMTRENFTKIITDLRQSGIEQIGLFYLGESTLVDWLPEAVAECCDLGFSNIFLTTNGKKMLAHSARELMQAGLTSLKFSLNYANPSQQQEIAGVKPAWFWDVESNIIATRAIRDIEGFSCELTGSYIAYDEEQNTLMQARVERLRPYLDQWYVMPLYSQGGKVEGRVAGNPGPAENVGKPTVPCWVLFTQAHVDYNGDLTMCCFDHEGDFVVGNLLKSPFSKLWNTNKFKELRAKHIQKNVKGTLCENCVHGSTYQSL